MIHYSVYLILTFTAVVFIVVSCFVKKAITRSAILIPSAIVAIFCIGTVSAKAACRFERFNYNAWYSMSTKCLIEVVIEKLEDGQHQRVIQELEALNSKIEGTYEVRGHYDEYVNETVKNLNADQTE